MYCKRFVNVITGQVFISFAHFDDKIEGVNGWTKISQQQYEYIRKNFCAQNFEQNLKFPSMFVLNKNLDNLKKYLKESK